MNGWWRLGAPLLLASASATRRSMLQAAGIPVEAVPAVIDERGLEDALSGESAPEAVAIALAEAKALAVSRLHAGRLVLGADQTLAEGERRLHKSADRAEARRQLLSLSGRTHRLDSAFALARDGRVLARDSRRALMTMRPLSADFIEAYLDAVGPAAWSSVGTYQIEGPGAQLFARIDGDHFTILGLPLLPLCERLRRLGALAD